MAGPGAAGCGAVHGHGVCVESAHAGDALFTLSQVALNDTIMVFAFAPIVGLLLGMSAIVVPWATLLISVLLYIVIPVVLAQVWRARCCAAARRRWRPHYSAWGRGP